MMFSEDSNYFGPPSGSVDASVWKPHPPHDLNNHNSNDIFANKWGPPGTKNNKDFVYDEASAKAAWNNGGRPGSTVGGDKTMGGAPGMGGTWGPPNDLTNDMSTMEQDFMQLNLKNPDFGHGAPTGTQWGRHEVNQAIPWDVDNRNDGMNRPPFNVPDGMPPQPRNFMQQPMPFDNGSNQWRQWDNDFGNKQQHDFNGPPQFPSGPIPGQFGHGRINNFVPQQSGFNERMPFQMRNGPPFHHGGPPHQPWIENKFGSGGHHQIHHPSMGGPNAGGRFPFGHPGQQAPPTGPPNMMMSGRPPLMPMQPPHPAAMPPNFQIGSFQPTIQNDDAFWQDPNGELRKWQRDTGTAIWGDPAKQNSAEIKRWIQPPTDSDEENILGSDPLREGKEEIETGWGPPPAPPGQKNPPQPPTNIGPPVVNNGWNEPPRIPPQGFPQGPNNFHANPPPANNWNNNQPPGSAADWTRPPGYQPAPHMSGYNDFNPNRNQEEVSRIAEKLRLAVSKDLLDVNLLSTLNQNNGLSNTAQANATLNLLNSMLAKVGLQEALEYKIKKLDPMNKKEIDRVMNEIEDVKKELQSNRDQIHNILKSSTNRGSILGDELSIDDQHQDLNPSSLGGVGQLW